MKCATAKRTRIHNTPAVPYPNAATKQEILNKFLDMLLMGAIGAGLAASLIFITVLFQ